MTRRRIFGSGWGGSTNCGRSWRCANKILPRICRVCIKKGTVFCGFRRYI
nr:MAG TPA: hypothetical protein [Caudoviricetes sp.]